jgi:hypothetical protein
LRQRDLAQYELSPSSVADCLVGALVSPSVSLESSDLIEGRVISDTHDAHFSNASDTHDTCRARSN